MIDPVRKILGDRYSKNKKNSCIYCGSVMKRKQEGERTYLYCNNKKCSFFKTNGVQFDQLE